jgi:NitT/TauT family transport system substrate-binding protein
LADSGILIGASKRRDFLRAAGLASGAAFVTGAGPALAAFATPEKPSLKLGIPVDAASFLPVYVAAARTWKEQGLDVQLLSFRGGAEVKQALAGDSVDLVFDSPTGVISMIAAGQPVIGFYSGCFQTDFSWLAQPSVKTWADLKGKTLGISTFGTGTDALTRYALQKHHLDPERDVQLVQAGGSPSSYQALKAGRLASAVLAAPFKWQAQDDGFTLLGTQVSEVSPQWPEHMLYAKTKFISDNPNTIAAVLRAHVAAIRLARADHDFAVAVMMDRLKYTRPWAQRAYEEAIPGYDERGGLPEKWMQVFWKITIAEGYVTEPWPESKFLDRRYIDSFRKWAP